MYKTDTPDFTDTIKPVDTRRQVPTSKMAAGMLHSSWYQVLEGQRGGGRLPGVLAVGVFYILCYFSAAVLFP